ncbi:hypothetical protein CEXT_726311 [Caerostris extrusa]|uniref:Uncharacterized protein n=1 Tax=Caerostris extrusa TaxID=172846 RepID=A0AAV4V694_CAEEX|nr:hypothetical protein CEXT_726311 [Caerostris extrusa]
MLILKRTTRHLLSVGRSVPSALPAHEEVQRAEGLRRVSNYYHFKEKMKGKFTGMNPSDMKKVIEMNNILYMPYRVPPGSHVAIFRLGE